MFKNHLEFYKWLTTSTDNLSQDIERLVSFTKSQDFNVITEDQRILVHHYIGFLDMHEYILLHELKNNGL